MSRLDNFSGCGIGAFVNGLDNLSSFQEMIGKKLAVVLWYVHWLEPFPKKETEIVFANGSIPLITWEPWITHPQGTLAAIASGEYDNYVKKFLQEAKEWGKPFFLRFAHEMNGNWYPWDGFHNGGTAAAAEKYKQAWLYLYNVKQELAVDNALLVWSPNNTDQPNESWNDLAAYYPGDEYVDWIGMDGYNWGYGAWEPFDAVFDGIYQRLVSLTKKPLMIGEFGAAEQGGDKAAWIKQSLVQIKREYPRIKLFCWFNINKERDWRIDSANSSVQAFKQAINNRYFVENLL